MQKAKKETHAEKLMKLAHPTEVTPSSKARATDQAFFNSTGNKQHLSQSTLLSNLTSGTFN